MLIYCMVRNNDKHTCHLIDIMNIASQVIFNIITMNLLCNAVFQTHIQCMQYTIRYHSTLSRNHVHDIISVNVVGNTTAF